MRGGLWCSRFGSMIVRWWNEWTYVCGGRENRMESCWNDQWWWEGIPQSVCPTLMLRGHFRIRQVCTTRKEGKNYHTMDVSLALSQGRNPLLAPPTLEKRLDSGVLCVILFLELGLYNLALWGLLRTRYQCFTLLIIKLKLMFQWLACLATNHEVAG